MRVGLIGSGNMARALARGWGDPVLCSDSGSGRAVALAEELGGRAASNLEVAREADLVVLCHKPYQLDAVAQEIAGDVKAVVSVLGSTSNGELSKAYPGTPVFRLIPNTPVELRQGVTCYAPHPSHPEYRIDEELERGVLELFGRVGTVVTVDEQLLGVATAVSSLGPAYQALLAEAQVDAAVRLGLKPALASQLVTETMSGTAALLTARDFDTLAVRREVTSPGGSTARGLDALERAGVRGAFQAAIDRVCEVPS
ncbi:MAG: pyrroline-5-carboxylate reductase [Solirubrobacteraceae bacterium]